MKTILVTGGAGFIGSHVVDLLVEKDMKVLIVDDMSSGNRAHVNTSHRVQLIEMDINNQEQLRSVFRQHQDIEGVVHLAAQSKVNPSLQNPIEDAYINITGTINVLEMCKTFGVNNVVYASSAAVYGQTTLLPIGEDTPVSPLSPYGVSKYAAEQYVQAYARLYDLQVSVLRFANVFGPRQSAATEAGVITIFIEQLLRSETPTIFGDGKQTRDFIYVADVAQAVVTCLLTHNDSSPYSVYNVSTAQEISISELLQEICVILNVDYQAHYKDVRAGDIHRSYLDNRRLVQAYKWKPSTSLHTGLLETLHYYQQQ